MVKCVVTGHKGFVGSQLCKELLNLDYDYMGVEKEIFNNEKWNVELENKLSNYEPDVIFHVGACSDTLESDANYMMTLNYEFTKILTNWCVKKDIPIIYSSSAANYGENSIHPSNLYGWSKYAGRRLC